MHVVASIFLSVAALVGLVLGLVSVVHDLLERGPHEAPLIKNDVARGPADRNERAGNALNFDLPRDFDDLVRR